MSIVAAAGTESHKIKRESLPDRLAESLRTRILSGEFEEGGWLVQDALAHEYGVSRMPVREALRQLEAAGLVRIETNKGAVVSSLPTEQIAELFELRALLECDLLSRAVPKISAERLATAKTVLATLEESYSTRDVAAWGRLNWEFHRTLYEPSGRAQTLRLLEVINMQTDRYVRLELLLSEAHGQARREHRELLRLAQAGLTERAVSCLKKHIENTAHKLLLALRKSRAERRS